MKDAFQELFLDLVHFVNERYLLVSRLHDIFGVWLKQMLDTVHLKVMDAVFELSLLAFGLCGSKGTDCCATSG